MDRLIEWDAQQKPFPGIEKHMAKETFFRNRGKRGFTQVYANGYKKLPKQTLQRIVLLTLLGFK